MKLCSDGQQYEKPQQQTIENKINSVQRAQPGGVVNCSCGNSDVSIL
jgi:hypothetical protein